MTGVPVAGCSPLFKEDRMEKESGWMIMDPFRLQQPENQAVFQLAGCAAPACPGTGGQPEMGWGMWLYSPVFSLE
jgi:hypothetical protein